MIKFIKQLIPQSIIHPFKTLQKSLSIEQEWADFKTVLRPHRLKIFLFCGILTYPLYVDSVRYAKIKVFGIFQNELNQGQPLETFINNFAKNEVQVILKDQQIQQESIDFVQRLAKQSQVQDSIVTLLKESIQNQSFMEESKVFGKRLVLELLDDKQIQEHTQKLIIQMVNDPIVKYEVKELFKGLAQDNEVKDAVVEILKHAADDPSFRQAFANAFAFAFNDLILRKDTTDKIRMFMLFLIETEKNQDSGIKGFIDLLIDKLLNRKTRISKVNDFEQMMESLYGKDQARTIISENKFQEENKENIF